jgi:penicillin-binding protein-related factor A (putative recombinase)
MEFIRQRRGRFAIGLPVKFKEKMIKNKGRKFELQIEKAMDQINHLGLGIAIRIEVRQAKTKTGNVYVKKQPFDYLVIANGLTWAFDAKECSQKKWYPTKAPEHQRIALAKMQSMRNCYGGFVVHFKRFGKTRWITDFDKPATPESGLEFDWEMIIRGEI